MPKLTFGDYWLELPTRFSKGQLTYLLYGKELSSSGSYLKLWVKKRLKISFDDKKKLENFDVLGHVNKFCRLKISNYLRRGYFKPNRMYG